MAPNSSQQNAYNGAQSTGVGVLYDALGNPIITGAKMMAGVGAGNVLASDGSGNLTLQPVSAASLPAATTTTQGAVILDGTAGDIQANGSQAAGSVGKAADAGHVHPAVEPFTATDAGLLAWNYDPCQITTSTALPTGGQVVIQRVNVRQAISVTNVVFFLGTLGNTLTSNQNFAGLYNSSGTLIGTSADQTTPWNTGGTTGLYTVPLVSGPFAVAAGFVWVAFLFNGTTGPSMARSQGPGATIANIGFSAAASRFAHTATGSQTTLPGSFTPSGNVQVSTEYWVALS